jgi:hypothetical protein
MLLFVVQDDAPKDDALQPLRVGAGRALLHDGPLLAESLNVI